MVKAGTLNPMLPPLELIVAKTSIWAVSLSGLFGFTLAQILTNQWALSAGAAVLAGLTGGGLVAAMAKVITARAQARSSDAVTRETAAESVFRRLKFTHDAEISFYQKRLAFKDLVAVLERKGKHRALSECQRLVWHINLLQSLLRTAGGEPPPFNFMTYEQLVGDEDDQIEKLAIARAQDSPTLTLPSSGL